MRAAGPVLTVVAAILAAAFAFGIWLTHSTGALVAAILGIADRYDPRRVLGLCAILAGLVNLTLLATVPGSASAIARRSVHA